MFFDVTFQRVEFESQIPKSGDKLTIDWACFGSWPKHFQTMPCIDKRRIQRMLNETVVIILELEAHELTHWTSVLADSRQLENEK
jgi:hypothetical protein